MVLEFSNNVGGGFMIFYVIELDVLIEIRVRIFSFEEDNLDTRVNWKPGFWMPKEIQSSEELSKYTLVYLGTA